MIHDLVYHPDERLRVTCDPVEKVDRRVQQLMRDLNETMLHEDRGVGLAAPQIGVLERIIAVNTRQAGETLLMANPVITWSSKETKPWREGCMSIPDVFAEVVRPDKVRVSYLDENSEPQEVEADGLLSVVLQHEIDHINGVLFIDHLSRLKRDLVLRRYNKLAKLRG